jgi:hypothetical protein
MYHSQLGRFVSRDPLGYPTPQYNLDEYVHGNPIGHKDPSGLASPWKPTYPQQPCGSGQWYCITWANRERLSLGWVNTLVNCPCSLSGGYGGTTPYTPGAGRSVGWIWTTPEPADPQYHHNAKWCTRAYKSSGGPGQQCCYDENLHLITHGPGAGTPDLISPGPASIWYPNWWWAAGRHYDVDVRTFEICEAVGLIDVYLGARPPNNGNNCAVNP